MILERFRFIDLRAPATAARDKLVSTSCLFAHAELTIDKATQRICNARISSLATRNNLYVRYLFNQQTSLALTIAACPAMPQSIPVRRKCTEAGSPI